ncbi:MAG: ABC transporter permease [Chlorobiaceae bacterium]
MTKRTYTLLIPLLSISTALLFSSAIIALAGRDPVMIFSKMVRATVGSPYGSGQLLFRMTTLILAGLAVALPFQAKLFNVGGEGQLQMGAFAAALTGALCSPDMPAPLALLLTLFSAMTAGALWALIPGVLKVRCSVNEVIATIMLNFIAQGVTGYLLTDHFALPSTEKTAPIIAHSTIPTFGALFGWFQSSPANLSIVISIGAVLFLQVLLFHSRAGYELRASGLQPDASLYGGINARRHTLWAMAAGGALAGLGAANLVLGYRHCYLAGMTSGTGFAGIAVALLAGANPLRIVLAALFFGFLEYGGLSVNAYIPKDIFMIIEAATILFVIAYGAAGKRIADK